MTDERRWTILVCGNTGAITHDCPVPYACEYACPEQEVVVVPVSSMVPITRLREAIERAVIETEDDGKNDLLRAIRAALDDVECASNPNEGTT